MGAGGCGHSVPWTWSFPGRSVGEDRLDVAGKGRAAGSLRDGLAGLSNWPAAREEELGGGCSCWKHDPLGADEDSDPSQGWSGVQRESEGGSESVNTSPGVTQRKLPQPRLRLEAVGAGPAWQRLTSGLFLPQDRRVALPAQSRPSIHSC